jgi:endonuclease YncB( thermonuclease family)
VNVIDGDTVDLFCDDGRRRYSLERYRLFGIDTPEMRSADPDERARALEAKAALMTLLSPAPVDLKRWPLVVRTHKADSFGRWLAELWFASSAVEGASINTELVRRGLAKAWVR